MKPLTQRKENYRELLDLADKLNVTELEMEKRKIDAEVLDKQSQLPQLKENYEELTSNLGEYAQVYEDARKSYVQYQEFLNRKQKIIATSPNEVQEREGASRNMR